jgi:hypothetical protein
MPGFAMIQQANVALSGGGAAALKSDPDFMSQIAQPGSLVSVAREVLDLSSDDLNYLEAIPLAVQEVIRATIYHAVAQSRDVHLSYQPGYDFAASVVDYVTAIGVTVTGPYTVPAARDAYL